MMRLLKTTLLPLLIIGGICISCGNGDDTIDPTVTLTELPAAFAAFNKDMTILIDGNEIVITTNGLPNHASPYWSNTTARTTTGPNGGSMTTSAAASNHPLFVAPTITGYAMMAPGNIDDFKGSYTLRIPTFPVKAASSSATGLGSIGLAVSGATIYNDEEGPNVPLDGAIGSLDYVGAHTGPQSYHYHLEPVAWSKDDDNLIGIIADGFFLYGRKCTSSGTYPVDLDASGGHTSKTKYNTTSEEYHYHIQDELYLSKYYILFPGNYQGTPNAVN
jgi:hypothetical protein